MRLFKHGILRSLGVTFGEGRQSRTSFGHEAPHLNRIVLVDKKKLSFGVRSLLDAGGTRATVGMHDAVYRQAEQSSL